MWNSLHLPLRFCSSISAFKTYVKNYLWAAWDVIFWRYYYFYSNLTILTYYQYYMDTLVSYLKLITILLVCLLLFPLACLCVIAYGLSIGTKIGDLEWPWTSLHTICQILEANESNPLKLDPYCQQQNVAHRLYFLAIQVVYRGRRELSLR